VIKQVVEDGKVVEVLSESVCFRIDEKFGSVHALAILAALQAYVRQCKDKTDSWNAQQKINPNATERRHELSLSLICYNADMYRFLIYWLSKEKVTILEYADVKLACIDDFDYYVDITIEKVMDVVRVGKLHLHQGIGILIGAATGSLADISVPEQFTKSGLCTIVLGSVSLRCAEALKEKFHTLTFISLKSMQDPLWGPPCYSYILDGVRESEAVIGPRCFATYAASCLQKPVLEINDENDDFWLLTQWSNRYYLPVTVKHDGSNLETVLTQGVKRLWDLVIKCRESAISTELASSVIENVGDL